jgi:hypothetical protein
MSKNKSKRKDVYGEVIVDGNPPEVRVGGNARPDAARCPKRSRRLISMDFLFLE